MELTDLVLLDIKEFNPEHHQSLTGRSNEQTLKTAAWLETKDVYKRQVITKVIISGLNVSWSLPTCIRPLT